jgi:hypothetical protein
MTSPNPGDAAPRVSHARRIVFIALVVLSIGGIGIMEYSEKYALWYWLAMAPVFGAASLGVAWRTAHERDATAGRHIRRQALHWLVLVVGLLLVFLMQRMEQFAPGQAGLLALLVLGLVTTLAGVHFEWRLSVLGGLLLLTFIAGVFVESFFWVLLIPTLLSIALLARGRGYDKV